MLGFTPSQMLELTLPQFFLYDRYARERLALKLDIATVNDWLTQVFGGRREKEEAPSGMPTITECEMDFDEKVNSIDNIAAARDSLREKTGKDSFNMSDIIAEIARLKQGKGYRFQEPGEDRKKQGRR